MKPFHTIIGALGFVEQNAQGPISVLIVQPKGRKLVTLKYRFFQSPIGGWFEERYK